MKILFDLRCVTCCSLVRLVYFDGCFAIMSSDNLMKPVSFERPRRTIHPSVHVSGCLYVCRRSSLSGCPYVCPSVCLYGPLPVHPSVCPPVRLSDWLSVCLPMNAMDQRPRLPYIMPSLISLRFNTPLGSNSLLQIPWASARSDNATVPEFSMHTANALGQSLDQTLATKAVRTVLQRN